MLSGFAEAYRWQADSVALADLLQRVAEERRNRLARPQPRGRPSRISTTISLGYALIDRMEFVRSTLGTARAIFRSWRGTESRGMELEELEDEFKVRRPSRVEQSEDVSEFRRAASTAALRKAYPRIDVDAGLSRRDVVVVDSPFRVTVGLGRYKDAKVTQSGVMTLSAGAATELDMVLVYDPNSLAITDATRFTLTVTDADPYPSAALTFTASHLEDPRSERRIGVHFLRDGQIVGIAWRSFVAVTTPAEVPTAEPPEERESALLDLDPLLEDEQPDLILSICASDGPAIGEFVWTAFAGASSVTVPDAPRISPIGSDLAGFTEDMRKTVQVSQGRYPDFRALTGKAMKLGRAIPEGINQVLQEVIGDPTRTTAPTVLLLTEELNVPWELSVLEPPLQSEWGGVSPFLGAHAAISRWPLTQHKPRPTPKVSVTVRRAAVLTARYEAVVGWGKLDDAEKEAAEIAAMFTPPAIMVHPSFDDVADLFDGTPPVDLLHVALHGQFDAQGDQGGLVLLASDSQGQSVTRSLFFTPDHVEAGRLDRGPFVFLNACQVASDKQVLGDYAGFASTLLRIGASGVIAPLWNVDDDVAAAFASDFYAATWTAPEQVKSGAPVSAAEAVRALRAKYTKSATQAETKGVTATLIAFQVFGHPRLTLKRSG
jgi:hypothetical protein